MPDYNPLFWFCNIKERNELLKEERDKDRDKIGMILY